MAEIALQRLVSQHIAGAHLNSPAEVVGWLGALQGQDYSGAKWSLGLRLNGATDASVEAALHDGHIYRTWIMRGTLHLVTAADIHWMIALVAPRLLAGNARRYRELELDDVTLSRTSDLLVGTLSDGKPRNRKALMAMLEQNGISTTGQRAPFILQHASLERCICQLETVRNDPMYQILPSPADTGCDMNLLDPDAGLVELARRYFRSRGPATLADFGWWTGLLVSDLRKAIARLADELVQETTDGQTYWRHVDTPDQAHLAGPMYDAYLLPGFDEYLLSYQDRSASIDMGYLRSLTPPNGMLPSTMVYRCRVVGLWKRTIQGKNVKVAFDPWVPLTADQKRAFADALSRYEAYIGLTAQLEQIE